MDMIQENVLLQLKHLETHPSVAAKLATNAVKLHGWVYDIEKGEVICYDADSNGFIPVGDWYDKVTGSGKRKSG